MGTGIRCLTTTAVLAMGLTLACHSGEELAGPRSPDTPGGAITPTPPAFLIADGARGGNRHFFFLPPLVPLPTFHGAPDPSVSPVAAVCPVDASTGTCGSDLARFQTVPRGSPLGQIRYERQTGSYNVVWDTRRCLTGPCSLDPARAYRLRVTVAGTELGSADLDVVARVRDLAAVNHQEAIGVVRGLPLLIRFRIEQGAVAVLAPSPQEQTVTAPSTVPGQTVEITVAGNTEVNGSTGAVGLTVEPVTSPPDVGALPGASYDFGPDGTTFSQPVTLAVPYDPAALGGIAEAKLRLYRLRADGKLEALAGSAVDVAANVVTGATDHFSTYVVAEQATAVDIVQPDLTLAIGQTSALDVTIDQAGRVVSWATSDPAIATVDGDGLVTAVAAGTASVTASSEGQSDQVVVTVQDGIVADFSLTVTTLGVLPDGYTFEHVGINPRHTVIVGNAYKDNGRTDEEGDPVPDYRVFVYTPEAGLRFLEGVYASADLSDANTERASGYARDDPSADFRQIVWDLATNASIHSAPGFGGSINDDNFVVGVCGEPELCGNNPTIRDPDGSLVHTLPHGETQPVSVARIGEQLEVVGTTELSGRNHAILWTPAAPTLRDLTPDLAFSAAVGINVGGLVTGHFDDAPTNRQGAFVWSEAGGLELLPNPFGTSVAPGTITDDGEVFGQTIFPDDPFRRLIIWTREGGAWVAKVSTKIPDGRNIGNTNNLGQTPAVNGVTGELELLTFQR